MAHEFGNNGLGSRKGDDADIETVLSMVAEGSLDRGHDPVFAVAEDAGDPPGSGGVSDVVVGSDCGGAVAIHR